jgi:histidine ammonia-lyase
MSDSNIRANQIKEVILSGEDLTIDQLEAIARHQAFVQLDESALKKVDCARQCIEERLATGESYYGINTGFGALSDVHIEPDKLSQLQLNLVRSHACGVGEPLPNDVVRAVLALRIQTMLRGHSGVRRETILLMKECLNNKITPKVPSQGSVGASGDLAPLAHIALALIGEGSVDFQEKTIPAAIALKQAGLNPLQPVAKEGLALINGTQVMCALGLLLAKDTHHLLRTADIAAAMTVDSTKGTKVAFRPEIQAVRPHVGQATSANNLITLLQDSKIYESHRNCGKVQDPYSLRCTPQVHGAIRDAYDHVLKTLLIEANSSTDNPLVFADSNEILSGGNFHGEPVALVLDYLAIAVSELAGISERRIEKLVNPHMSGLPPFLTHDSGLNSGYMIPQVVAAALTSENKVFAHPASVDSIPTSAEKEDHVSMGMTAAHKLRKIIENVAHVLAIEILTNAEALEFHAPLEGGIGVRAAFARVRKQTPPMKTDRSLSEDIKTLAQDVISGNFAKFVDHSIGQELY